MQRFFESKTLFIGGWLWVLLTGLALQMLIIPATPWHAGHGLLAGGDWVQFQEQALRLAAAIESQGWSAWELRFEGQAPASMAAAVYALTGISAPWVLLPIQGLLYGLAIRAAVAIARHVGVHERLLWLVVLPFALPSSTLIYGQIHKDILSLPGVLLVAWAWVRILAGQGRAASQWGYSIISAAMGILLVWWARPYQAQLLLMSGLLIGVGAFMGFGMARRWAEIMAAAMVLTAMLATYRIAERLTLPAAPAAPAAPACATWRQEVTIPVIAEAAASLFCYRHGFIQYHSGYAGNIDHNHLLSNYGEAFRYLPRALQIGVLAPFPTHWFGEASSPGGHFKRLLSGVEMIVIYLLLLGLVWVFRSIDQWYVLMVLGIMGVVGVLFYAYSSPNIGALYRYRFPFLILLILNAALGWSNRLTATCRTSGV